MKRRRYTGRITCEFCGHKVGGSTKSGLFSNYNSHCLARHPWYSDDRTPCRCSVCRKEVTA